MIPDAYSDSARSDRFLRFGGYPEPVRFINCDDMIDGFKSILLGWRVEELPVAGSVPAISIAKRAGSYHWRSRLLPASRHWRRNPPRTVMNAVAGFHYRFPAWHLVENPLDFCIHGAAVELGGALVVFPSTFRAGKSTLIAELARRGCRVFCDDVLPINPDSLAGTGLGLQPRLRLPLPASLPASYTSFIQSKLGLNDDKAGYILLGQETLAPYGRSAPIRAMVLLGRTEETSRCELEPASQAQVLASIVERNFATSQPASAIFDFMFGLVSGCERFTLRYFDVGEAAQTLMERFE